MFFVDYYCPSCCKISNAPLVGIVEGDAGIWVCDHCDGIYQVRIELRPLDVEGALEELQSRASC